MAGSGPPGLEQRSLPQVTGDGGGDPAVLQEPHGQPGMVCSDIGKAGPLRHLVRQSQQPGGESNRSHG